MKRTYTATDGTVFTDRNLYRKHEMETQYTFRDKTNQHLTKAPGTVNGQPFDIFDCHHTTITITDHTDQVQIDNVSHSRIFIGATSGSLFIRNCHDCVVTVACKQLRTRDCVDCTFYLHCQTEPVIEESVGMMFAPFNDTYPEHESHMTMAHLDPDRNLWYEIFDFTPPTNGGKKNWSLLDANDIDDAWSGGCVGDCSSVTTNDDSLPTSDDQQRQPQLSHTTDKIDNPTNNEQTIPSETNNNNNNNNVTPPLHPEQQQTPSRSSSILSLESFRRFKCRNPFKRELWKSIIVRPLRRSLERIVSVGRVFFGYFRPTTTTTTTTTKSKSSSVDKTNSKGSTPVGVCGDDGGITKSKTGGGRSSPSSSSSRRATSKAMMTTKSHNVGWRCVESDTTSGRQQQQQRGKVMDPINEEDNVAETTTTTTLS